MTTIKKFISYFCNFAKVHPFWASFVNLLLGALLGWGLSWILPTKPVIASNIPQKELTCTTNYSHNLVHKYLSDDKLQVTYAGHIATDPHFYDISIRNSGNLEIDNADFKEPFVIEFCGSGAILSAQVTKSSNNAVASSVLSTGKVEGENLIFEDFFLNPGEEFSIIVITDQNCELINYHSRISGISNISLRNTPREKHNLVVRVGFIFLSIVLLAVIVMFISEVRFNKIMRRERDQYKAYWSSAHEGQQTE